MTRKSLLIAGLTLVATAASASPSSAQSLDLTQYKGKVVYLDFWASWCAPCRLSFPWLASLQSAYRREGLTVVAVNVDHNRADAERFLSNEGSNFGIIYDPKGLIASKYNVVGMPMSVLIDKDGKVRFKHVGFYPQDEATYLSQVNQLLSEARP